MFRRSVGNEATGRYVVNNAVEKFRLWLLDHYHTYLEDLLVMVESKIGNCNVNTVGSDNR